MNNAIIIQRKDPSEKDSNILEEISKGDDIRVATVIRSLDNLKENVHFTTYLSEIIIPKLRLKEKKLSLEKDVIEIYRLQGSIEILKEISELDSLKKNFKNKLLKQWQKNNNQNQKT